MDFLLLGEFQAIHDETVLELGGRRRQAVLAVLLLNAGRTLSRQQIAQWAWPGDPPDSSGNLIANYISGLSKALRPAGPQIRLSARPPGFVAELDPALIDVHRFGDLVRTARSDLDGNEPQSAAARLRQALGLWRGNALDGLNTGYLDQRRTELEAARRSATILLARIHLDAQQPEQAVELLRELVAAEPGSEPSTVLLIQALTAAGDGAAAADLADPEAARAWLRTEQPNLDAAFTHAHTDHLDQHTIALAEGLAEIRYSDGPWARALHIHQAAQTAAGRDRPTAYANALNCLGRLRHQVVDLPGAMDAQERALEIHRRIGNRLGEANALNNLGRVRYLTRDLPEAADTQAVAYLNQALEIFRRPGMRLDIERVQARLSELDAR